MVFIFNDDMLCKRKCSALPEACLPRKLWTYTHLPSLMHCTAPDCTYKCRRFNCFCGTYSNHSFLWPNPASLPHPRLFFQILPAFIPSPLSFVSTAWPSGLSMAFCSLGCSHLGQVFSVCFPNVKARMTSVQHKGFKYTQKTIGQKQMVSNFEYIHSIFFYISMMLYHPWILLWNPIF